ncbi:hypothetical protein [Streptomyces qinglanensis]|uniref:VG15 protein n=1 Tax=Streptomyces qinglanensis TaxID=943816 RepID=UPI001EF79927|nr:hypothetical protein [Streptomyces qinglanensis]
MPARMGATLPPWMEAVDAVVRQYGDLAAQLAAEVYEAQRAAADVTSAFTVPLADSPPQEQTQASLRWATKDLWPRDPDDPRTTAAQAQPVEVRLAAAEKKTAAVVEKLVLDQGRQTTRQAVQRDREAVGYARAAALGACAFCRLMASRGMVYKSAGTAGRDANDRFSGDASVAKYHDHCSCQIISVFRGQRFELSPQAARWDRIYREYAQGHPGDQLRLFRRAIAEHDASPVQ